jgi:hypothetical protein
MNEVGQRPAVELVTLALSPRPDCEQGGTQEPPVNGYGKLTTFACSRSAPEHDHKLFPRPPTATIIVGNDGPDLVGASGG